MTLIAPIKRESMMKSISILLIWLQIFPLLVTNGICASAGTDEDAARGGKMAAEAFGLRGAKVEPTAPQADSEEEAKLAPPPLVIDGQALAPDAPLLLLSPTSEQLQFDLRKTQASFLESLALPEQEKKTARLAAIDTLKVLFRSKISDETEIKETAEEMIGDWEKEALQGQPPSQQAQATRTDSAAASAREDQVQPEQPQTVYIVDANGDVVAVPASAANTKKKKETPLATSAEGHGQPQQPLIVQVSPGKGPLRRPSSSGSAGSAGNTQGNGQPQAPPLFRRDTIGDEVPVMTSAGGTDKQKQQPQLTTSSQQETTQLLLLANRLERKDEKIRILEQRNAELSKENRDLRHQVRAENLESYSDRTVAAATVVKETDKIDSLDSEKVKQLLVDRQQALAHAEREQAKAIRTTNQIKAEYDSLNERNEQEIEAKKQLAARLKAAEEERNALKEQDYPQQIRDIQAALTAESNRLRLEKETRITLSEANEKLKKDLKALEDRNTALGQEASHRAQRMSALQQHNKKSAASSRSALEKLRKQHAELIATHATVTQRLETLQEENAALRKESAEQERLLTSMRQSQSPLNPRLFSSPLKDKDPTAAASPFAALQPQPPRTSGSVADQIEDTVRPQPQPSRNPLQGDLDAANANVRRLQAQLTAQQQEHERLMRAAQEEFDREKARLAAAAQTKPTDVEAAKALLAQIMPRLETMISGFETTTMNPAFDRLGTRITGLKDKVEQAKRRHAAALARKQKELDQLTAAQTALVAKQQRELDLLQRKMDQALATLRAQHTQDLATKLADQETALTQRLAADHATNLARELDALRDRHDQDKKQALSVQQAQHAQLMRDVEDRFEKEKDALAAKQQASLDELRRQHEKEINRRLAEQKEQQVEFYTRQMAKVKERFEEEKRQLERKIRDEEFRRFSPQISALEAELAALRKAQAISSAQPTSAVDDSSNGSSKPKTAKQDSAAPSSTPQAADVDAAKALLAKMMSGFETATMNPALHGLGTRVTSLEDRSQAAERNAMAERTRHAAALAAKQQELDDLRNQYAQDLAQKLADQERDLKASHAAELTKKQKEFEAVHATALDLLRNQHTQAMALEQARLDKLRTDELAAAQLAYQTQLAALQTQHDQDKKKALLAQQAQHAQLMQAAEDRFNQAKLAQQQKHERLMREAEDRLKSELAAEQKKALDALQAQHAIALAAARSARQDEIDELNRRLAAKPKPAPLPVIDKSGQSSAAPQAPSNPADLASETDKLRADHARLMQFAKEQFEAELKAASIAAQTKFDRLQEEYVREMALVKAELARLKATPTAQPQAPNATTIFKLPQKPVHQQMIERALRTAEERYAAAEAKLAEERESTADQLRKLQARIQALSDASGRDKVEHTTLTRRFSELEAANTDLLARQEAQSRTFDEERDELNRQLKAAGRDNKDLLARIDREAKAHAVEVQRLTDHYQGTIKDLHRKLAAAAPTVDAPGNGSSSSKAPKHDSSAQASAAPKGSPTPQAVDVDALKAFFTQEAAHMEPGFGDLGTRVNNLGGRVQQVEQIRDRMDRAMRGLRSKTTKAQERAAAFQQQYQEANDRANSTQETLDQTQDELKQANADRDALRDQLDQQREQFEQLRQRKLATSQKLRASRTLVIKLQHELKSSHDRFQHLSDTHAQLRTANHQLTLRISSQADQNRETTRALKERYEQGLRDHEALWRNAAANIDAVAQQQAYRKGFEEGQRQASQQPEAQSLPAGEAATSAPPMVHTALGARHGEPVKHDATLSPMESEEIPAFYEVDPDAHNQRVQAHLRALAMGHESTAGHFAKELMFSQLQNKAQADVIEQVAGDLMAQKGVVIENQRKLTGAAHETHQLRNENARLEYRLLTGHAGGG